MSNVLIGIIGVILFIGLALAGALILGPDFASASSASTAAALMSQMKQAADAADMRKLKLGVAYNPATTTAFLAPRFLKTAAVNPTAWARANSAAYEANIEFNNNLYLDPGPETPLVAIYVVAGIGPYDDPKARAVCQNIADSFGDGTIPDYRGNGIPNPTSPVGCVAGGSSNFGPMFIAYNRVENGSLSPGTPSGY